MTHSSFPCMFISILYMFRATICSSSGESIVSIRHLVYVTPYRWPSDMQVWIYLHTRRSPTYSDIRQMLYWYNWFSWWWANGCSKHVENWNKHTRKRTVRHVGYLQELYRDARSAEHKILSGIFYGERSYCMKYCVKLELTKLTLWPWNWTFNL